MGGKSKKVTVGYWYMPMFHHGLGIGPIDAFLEFRAGDRTAWAGQLTDTGTISVNAPNLFGGEKDQGGIVGEMDVLFGKADQQPNAYLLSALGNQIPGWRGIATVVWKGGKYGAMNPYPQPASYKVMKIKMGWEPGECWYPEKAEIDMHYGQIAMQIGETSEGWSYKIVSNTSTDDYSAEGFDHSSWAVGSSPFASATGHPYAPAGGWPNVVGTEWPINSTLWTRRIFTLSESVDVGMTIFVDNYATVWVNGTLVLPRIGDSLNPSVEAFMHEFVIPAAVLKLGDNVIALKAEDYGTYTYAAFRVSTDGTSTMAMNPAHVLYYAATHREMGREPAAGIDEASFTAGADWFYSQGFGICTSSYPSAESAVEFSNRIQRVAACSVSRDVADGKLHLDIANGVYDLATLPVLTDDDILEWSEQPTAFDGAINSVSVKYFDPIKKQDVVTPPVQALDLVDAYGVIHQTFEYPEIPTAALALRVAKRELQSAMTPKRTFEQKVTRAAYALRPNQYMRLQCPKRAIADMVCIVGSKQTGTLKSGAIALVTSQDIYSLPQTTIVEQESGVDTTPSQTPLAIALQAAFEAPYIELARTLASTDLAVLPPEASYVMAVADDPATSINYSMFVQPAGGEYTAVEDSEWCPTALVVEGDATRTATTFTLSDGRRLGNVVIGSAALWGSEIVRVDALDTAGITLGRGCADTVAAVHAPNERIWFYDDAAASDITEYVSGETLNVKLLTNTGSQQLPISAATPISVQMQGRASLPYPPGNVQIAAAAWPATVAGEFTVAWAHRDRIAQADQLIDDSQPTLTLPQNQRYGLRFSDGASTVLVERTDIGAGTATVVLAYTGNVVMTLWTIDDIGESLQQHTHTFAYTPPSPAPAASTITATAYKRGSLTATGARNATRRFRPGKAGRAAQQDRHPRAGAPQDCSRVDVDKRSPA